MKKQTHLVWFFLGAVTALILGAGLFLTVREAQAEPLPLLQPTGSGINTAIAPFGSPLVVSPAAFGDDGGTQDYFFYFYGGLLSGSDCWKAAVYLPNGVRVDRMYMTVYDNDSVGNFSVNLRRKYSYSTAADTEIMGTLISDGYVDGYRYYGDTAISYPYVEQPEYSYMLTSCGYSASTALQSVRIYFTYRYGLPLILRNPLVLAP